MMFGSGYSKASFMDAFLFYVKRRLQKNILDKLYWKFLPGFFKG
jgi:hypothetical protein